MANATSHHGTAQKCSGGKDWLLQINIGSQVDDLADGPAQRHADNAAENSHSAGFGEEKLLHISVTGADGFHDADFAAALENRHHQRIHDSDRRDGQRQAAENSEKYVQHAEKLSAGCGWRRESRTC